MPDPFEQLRDPDPVAEPDAAFRAGLRTRLEQALTSAAPAVAGESASEEGSTMMATQPLADVAVALGARLDVERSSRAGRPTAQRVVVPYLTVDNAAAALDWYVAALGARIASEPIVMPDGRIGHVELDFAGAPVYLSDGFSESHVAGPTIGADATVTLVLDVPSVDDAVANALEHGALLERPADDHPYGRNAVIRDPFWHRWMISGPLLGGAPVAASAGWAGPIREGDVGYASLWVPDEARARRFFSDVLGWPLEGNRDVSWRAVSHGVTGGSELPTLFCAYAVEDVNDAARRVWEADGTAEEPVAEPWGRTVDCTDPEGLRFALYELPTDGAGRPPRPLPNGERHGDLAYITMHSVSSEVARTFYSAVLGWRFVPGRIEDGWGLEGVAPMTGLSGGHDRPSIAPMYRVDDIAGAVRRVRAVGGTATDPELQPYGWSSECHDDQGTFFYLGQL